MHKLIYYIWKTKIKIFKSRVSFISGCIFYHLQALSVYFDDTLYITAYNKYTLFAVFLSKCNKTYEKFYSNILNSFKTLKKKQKNETFITILSSFKYNCI